MSEEKNRKGQWRLHWLPKAEAAQEAARPEFPNGIDVDLSEGSPHSCKCDLPYPAAGNGMHAVECLICGLRAGVTAAGRVDDPKSVKFRCKTMGEPKQLQPRGEWPRIASGRGRQKKMRE